MLAVVISNLVNNAIKYSKSGGKIVLNAQINNDQKNFFVAVKDHGAGISRENIDKLFKINIVHTVNGTADEKGSGLGLIVSKEMMDKNNGQI